MFRGCSGAYVVFTVEFIAEVGCTAQVIRHIQYCIHAILVEVYNIVYMLLCVQVYSIVYMT